ncbi:flagellar hook-associated protein FlgK [Lysinibacillus agricola]|uniref:Flagellar hook-associated protein 1 n=1 Tax=Lysinibacillus agricola TaxID=2590012 RepID=A0ABX7AU13_9BACI|nr:MULTISPECIES: flagellar hook-associated protein FlgK [Lysinibacillus]KOS60742.1 flagellar biosynthesis protein FlgK [Lysinibacillus sp. FJAT-14222]QQP13240.1 flagellar hook-associated protein FlgK [Lysinibacillus agricola]
MRSTFMGLEASKRGLFTQQTALYTTGHNISNANTLGYSRQRVNMEATAGFPAAGLNQPNYPGHLGTGVQAGSIQRIRDEFVDRQFRQETNKLGYWESRSNAISQMEDIMDEPSQYGLNAALEQFWKGLQDVSTNPENTASRKVAMQRAEHLAESFRYMDKQLKTIQGNLGNEVNVATNRINSLLKQIAAINKQVQEVEPNGHVPNDLYDERDVLIDELNNYIPVSIKRVESGGNASAVAEGSLTVVFKPYGTDKEIELVNGKDYATFEVNGTVANPSGSKQIDGTNLSNMFSSIQVSGLGSTESIAYDDLEPGKGKLLSLIDSYGYDSAGESKGYYIETLASLDKLAAEFAEAFNEMHKKGYDLSGDKNDIDFFTTEDGSPITAGNIRVNDDFLNDPSKLAASSGPNEEGNGKWALELANIQSKGQASLNGATFNSYYQGMIGKLGTDGEEAYRLNKTSETLLVTLSGNRASVSSVSLDEEMTNMITFQQAYNANARMITVVDETLDKIINGMGRVGL